MKYFILLILIFTVLTRNAKADENWENLTKPEKLRGEISAIAINGEEAYLGTVGDGIWYSSNLGVDWTNNFNDQMLKDSITFIRISPTGSVFATGQSNIYKSTDNGREWTTFYDITRQQESINCISIGQSGKIAIGTNRSIFISDKETDGSQWYKISTDLGPFYCYSIIVDFSETIFVSGSRDLKNNNIFRYQNQKLGWTETLKNISEDPIVNDFQLDENFQLFAAISSSIYSFDYEKKVWNLFVEDKDDNILKFRFAEKGRFVTLGRKIVKVYELGDRIGKIITDLDASGLREIIITKKNRFIGFGKGNITISKGDLSDIIASLLTTKFTVRDANGNLLSNRTFKLYKAECDANQTFLKDVTTNSLGVFSLALAGSGLAVNDRIKIEKTVFSKNSVKSGHEALEGKMYEIRLNNQKFDGLGAASYYQITSDMEQSISLDNSVVYHNVLISVEWDAKKAFLDTLASWCRLMSDFFYDVTDGQLIINKVAIYDNKQKWDQADVRFFASNQVWPNASVGGIEAYDTSQAQVRMPRRWWGNGGDTRNLTSLSNWYERTDDDNFMGTSSTLAHELGHYMLGFFDEYVFVDTNKAKLLPDGYNYGFMCYQYQNGNEWSSELSSAVRYPNSNYQITLQWYYHNKDCWSHFESKYENTYTLDGLTYYCPIRKPSERTLNSGLKYLLGPADHMSRQNTCFVRNVTQIQIFDQNYSSGDFRFTAVNGSGVPLGNVSVGLTRSYGSITINKPHQGNTPDDGQMLVLGAEVGDAVVVVYYTKVYYPFIGYIDFPAFAVTPVNSITTFDKKKNDVQLEVPRIVLNPIKGTFELMNSINFDTRGKATISSYSTKPFLGESYADIQISEDTLINVKLNYSLKEEKYNISLEKAFEGEGIVRFFGNDSAGNIMPVPIFYSISSAKDNNFAPFGNAELSIENLKGQISKIGFTSCKFPSSRNGISSNQEHVGEYLSFSTYPVSLNQNSINVLTIRYDEKELIKHLETELRIFRWDESKLSWIRIGGLVDTVRKLVSAPVTQAGLYTLFTENNGTGLNDNGFDDSDMEITPNPASKNCFISLNIQNHSYITIKIFDSFGNEMKTIYNGYADQGISKFSLDSEAFSSGVYNIRATIGNKIISNKLIILK